MGLAGAAVLGLSVGAEAAPKFDGVTITHFSQAGAADRLAGYKALAD